ncbi:MAG: Na(+)-translocating NADH-quinone reductase subunit C [Pirellulaceae bacterium]
MHKDSIANTIIVAVGVCLVCSLLVSAAAVGLRERQTTNVELDRKVNILRVAGFDQEAIDEAGGIPQLFEKVIRTKIVNLETGKEDVEGLIEASNGRFNSPEQVKEKFDPIQISKDQAKGTEALYEVLSTSEDVAGIGARENWAIIYTVVDDSNAIQKYVFPIRGRGLWSTLKGFISLEKDLATVGSITYFEHGETPGLGGEVDNPRWKAKWHDKKVYGPNDNVQLTVVKGSGEGEHQIDGLAGATITSNGVSNMIHFWLGPMGYKPFIQNQNGETPTQEATAETEHSVEGE